MPSLRLARCLAACLAATLVVGPAHAYTVQAKAKDEKAILKAIAKVAAKGGGRVLIVSKGDPIVINQSIVIDSDNITLEGEGPEATRLVLADNVNAPVIVIGQAIAAPTVTRRHIAVRNLSIDGNRHNQTSELNPDNPALRNNGISLRRVEDCTVENVVITRCRSGGLVTELGCRRLTIRHLQSADHTFDGLAGYATTDSVFSDLRLHDNLAAGLSFDLHFDHNLFSNVVIADCGTVGIFMRMSQRNAFVGLQIRNCGEHGIFLAQVDDDVNTPAKENTFTACVIADNGGAGVWVADPSCVRNIVTASIVPENGEGDIEASDAQVIRYGNYDQSGLWPPP
jgi:hypothetical protein